MVALALDLAARDALVGNTVVVTVMSNLGLHIALHAAGIETVATAVGDRAVMAAIEAGGFVLGGEQSGHVIVRNRATTGDGTLTGLLFADALLRGVVAPTASALAACMQPLPQVLVNVKMSAMPDLDRADTLWEAVRRETEVLGTTGRVLVRASGTEPLIRVMVEAASVAEAEAISQRLADVARALRG